MFKTLSIEEAIELLRYNQIKIDTPKENEKIYAIISNDLLNAYISFREEEFESSILGIQVFKIINIFKNNINIDEFISFINETTNKISNNKKTIFSLRSTPLSNDDSIIYKKIGFNHVESLITLELKLKKLKSISLNNIEIATRVDAVDCGEIAFKSFKHDRFHKDTLIQNDKASLIKREWAINACKGRSDNVFIFKKNKKILGFNSCILENHNSRIDLIAVDPEYSSQGIGRQLVAASINYYSHKKKKSLLVGTQSTNIPSLKLYFSFGFKSVYSSDTFHLWR